MTAFKSDFLNVLQERGFIHQCSDFEGLDALAAKGEATAYVGYDCTAPSLHIGNFLTMMMLYWLQQSGNKPITLMGGGTTMVGDPSGKDETRALRSIAEIEANKASIRGVFAKVLRFGTGASDAIMLDNAEWLTKLNWIEMLRQQYAEPVTPQEPIAEGHRYRTAALAGGTTCASTCRSTRTRPRSTAPLRPQAAAASASRGSTSRCGAGWSPGDARPARRARRSAAWSASRRSCRTAGSTTSPRVDDVTLYEGMARGRALGLPVAVHAENDALTAGLALAARRRPHGARDFLARGRSSPSPRRSHGRSRSPPRPAARCTSCTSPAARGVALVAEARARGRRRDAARPARTTWCSTRTTSSASARSRSARRRYAPRPMRGAVAAVRGPGRSRWSRPTTRRRRPRSSRATTCSPSGAGSPGRSRRWSCSWARASSAGGSISGRSASSSRGRRRGGSRFAARARSEPGNDGDLVPVDVGATRVLAAEGLRTRHAISPYVGRELRARVVRTVLSACTALDGQVAGEPSGRLLKPV